MEAILPIAYTALFLFLIRKLRFFEIQGFSRRSIQLVFLLKIAAGVILWWIYTFHYTNRLRADIYKYFDDSAILFSAIYHSPMDFLRMLTGIGDHGPAIEQYYHSMHFWERHDELYNGGHTVIRFNAFLRLFSMGLYNVHTVFTCFLSLTGLTAIYKSFQHPLAENRNLLFIIVFLVPSVLFWGSGVLKESLILFATGILVWQLQPSFTFRSLIICVLALLFLLILKVYVFVAILPGTIFFIITRKTSARHAALKYFAVLAVVAAAGLTIHHYTSLQDPMVLLSAKQSEFIKLANGESQDASLSMIPAAGSRISVPVLEPTLVSFIKNSPAGLVNALFRPFPSDVSSPLLLLSAVENIFITGFIILCLFSLASRRSIKWEYVFFCFSFALIQLLIVGEITPVIGAVARYRTVALPFLLIGFLLLAKNLMPLLRLLFAKRGAAKDTKITA